MSIHAAIQVLDRIEDMVESASLIAIQRGQVEAWRRDKLFIDEAREDLSSENQIRVKQVLDQMQNLSQGFGSYCENLQELDDLLDSLCNEIVLSIE